MSLIPAQLWISVLGMVTPRHGNGWCTKLLWFSLKSGVGCPTPLHHGHDLVTWTYYYFGACGAGRHRSRAQGVDTCTSLCPSYNFSAWIPMRIPLVAGDPLCAVGDACTVDNGRVSSPMLCRPQYFEELFVNFLQITLFVRSQVCWPDYHLHCRLQDTREDAVFHDGLQATFFVHVLVMSGY